jgi:hypothetical protein
MAKKPAGVAGCRDLMIVVSFIDQGAQSWIQIPCKQASKQASKQDDLLFLLKSHVSAYTRKDGTFVKEHDDKRFAKGKENFMAGPNSARQAANTATQNADQKIMSRSAHVAASKLHMAAAHEHDKAARNLLEDNDLGSPEYVDVLKVQADRHRKQSEYHARHAYQLRHLDT